MAGAKAGSDEWEKEVKEILSSAIKECHRDIKDGMQAFVRLLEVLKEGRNEMEAVKLDNMSKVWVLEEEVASEIVRVCGEMCLSGGWCVGSPGNVNVTMGEMNVTTSDGIVEDSTFKSLSECVQHCLRFLFVSNQPKAKTARAVRRLLDTLGVGCYTRVKGLYESKLENLLLGSDQVPIGETAGLLLQEEVCVKCVSWCITEKRTFLRLRVQTRLALVLLQLRKLQAASQLVDSLLFEARKLDDKLLLLEILLIQTKLMYFLKNFPKAKTALTAARTNANAIHCPLSLQGDIHILAGMIHTLEETRTGTAFSHFFEAHEAFSNLTANSRSFSLNISTPIHVANPDAVFPIPDLHKYTKPYAEIDEENNYDGGSGEDVSTSIMPNDSTTADNGSNAVSSAIDISTNSLLHAKQDSRALQAFKYMLLSKILAQQPHEVRQLLAAKGGLKYASNPEITPLISIADCCVERSLLLFEKYLVKHRRWMIRDPFLAQHIYELYDTLLERNLLKVLLPFNKVEIKHVADIIDLPVSIIETKLAELILDGKLSGTLDQGVGVLILFGKPPVPTLYQDVLATIENMAVAVDSLYEKAQL